MLKRSYIPLYNLGLRVVSASLPPQRLGCHATSVVWQRAFCSSAAWKATSHCLCSSSSSPPHIPPPPPPEVTDELSSVLKEVKMQLRARVPIGTLFKMISKDHQRILCKHRVTLEEFLLHFPHHFTTFRSKSGTKAGVIQVCLPFQAPPLVRQLSLPASALRPALVHLAKEESRGMRAPPSRLSSSASRGGSDDGGMPLTRTQKLQLMLDNVPDTWTAFTDLKVPQKIKEEVMGYPAVKPMEFFQKLPHLFETKHERGTHTFFVRRR